MPNLLDAFEQHLRIERRCGALTVARYRKIVDEFARRLASNPETAGVDLSKATRSHCVDFLQTPGRTATEEPSRSVWNQRLSALRSLYQYLLDKQDLEKNPTLGIKRHKISSRERIPLSLDEFRALVEAAGRLGPVFRTRAIAILQVLLNTGLRVRELVSLDVEQIDWQAATFVNVRTKGEKWHSTKFNKPAADSLRDYLTDRARPQLVASGALFLSMRGTRLSVRAAEELVSSLGRAAGIKRPVTPHLFRHSCATKLDELGTRRTVTQGILGHASLATTELYIHTQAGADRVAIDTLGAAVMEALQARLSPAPAA